MGLEQEFQRQILGGPPPYMEPGAYANPRIVQYSNRWKKEKEKRQSVLFTDFANWCQPFKRKAANRLKNQIMQHCCLKKTICHFLETLACCLP